MRRALWLLIFIVAAVPAHGELASKLRVGLWPPVELPAEILTTIYSGRLTYPNDYVDSVDFDIVNAADDGSTIRYGYVSSANKDVYQGVENLLYSRGTTTERAYTPPTAPLFYAFIWMSLDGVRHGDRITRADLFTTVSRFATQSFGADDYITVRVDTVSADYEVDDSTSQTDDLCRFNFTWNDMNLTDTGANPWVPSLSSRGNWFEFGPRSSTVLDAVAYNTADGDSNVFSIIDGIQKIADRGQEYIDRGALITVAYIGSTTNTVFITAGHNANVRDSGGNSALALTTSNRRGQKMWGNGKVPVSLTFDDCMPWLPEYYNTLNTGAAKFDFVVPFTAWEARKTAMDSLHALEHENMNFVAHSTTHTVLGSLTGSVLNDEVAKDWINSANFTVAPDTSYMNLGFAWPGGVSTFYGIEALWKLPVYGYNSARGVGVFQFDTCPVGDTNWPSWDHYTNIYTINAWIAGTFLETGGLPEYDPEVIKDRLRHYVDIVQTDHGRGALVTYGHNIDNGITPWNLATIDSIITTEFYLERQSLDEIVETMRARGFTDIDDVVTATSGWSDSFGDSLKYFMANRTAVRQNWYADGDSVTVEPGTSTPVPITAEGAAAFDKMWVGPATE